MEIGPNLSREIYLSEEALGTLRDTQGNNKYTYHPEYNISYTNNIWGEFEKSLANFPRSNRTEFIIREAAWYPPLYYLLGGTVYNLYSFGSLFDRVFLVRISHGGWIPTDAYLCSFRNY